MRIRQGHADPEHAAHPPGTFAGTAGRYGELPRRIGEDRGQSTLRQYLAPVREFQLAYNAHIHVGEFSAIRWAPDRSAFRYLRDCIDIFEEYGWDWSYHAYRERDGWSVEDGPDPEDHQPTTAPTDRKRLLLEWFARNQKPPNAGHWE